MKVNADSGCKMIVDAISDDGFSGLALDLSREFLSDAHASGVVLRLMLMR